MLLQIGVPDVGVSVVGVAVTMGSAALQYVVLLRLKQCCSFCCPSVLLVLLRCPLTLMTGILPLLRITYTSGICCSGGPSTRTGLCRLDVLSPDTLFSPATLSCRLWLVFCLAHLASSVSTRWRIPPRSCCRFCSADVWYANSPHRCLLSLLLLPVLVLFSSCFLSLL
jgi:hypothetical protein